MEHSIINTCSTLDKDQEGPFQSFVPVNRCFSSIAVDGARAVQNRMELSQSQFTLLLVAIKELVLLVIVW